MENKIELSASGKIAKFPKNTKAVRALQFLEEVKVNQNKLWYIVIEDQGTDLKMVKYNRSKGVNLFEYTTQLKKYYMSKYSTNEALITKLEAMIVEGEQDFSVIKNIPQLMIEENLTLISKITSDLIKLLGN